MNLDANSSAPQNRAVGSMNAGSGTSLETVHFFSTAKILLLFCQTCSRSLYQFPGNAGNALTFVFSPGRITAAKPLRIQRT